MDANAIIFLGAIIAFLASIFGLLREWIGWRRDRRLTPSRSAAVDESAADSVEFRDGRLKTLLCLISVACLILVLTSVSYYVGVSRPRQLWIQALNERIARYPEHSGYALALRGNERYSQGDYQDAVTDYSSAIGVRSKLDRDSARELYFNRGIAYVRLGELERAKADFSRSWWPNSLDSATPRNPGFRHNVDF